MLISIISSFNSIIRIYCETMFRSANQTTIYGFSFSPVFTVVSSVKSQGTSSWLERNINKTKVITYNEGREVKMFI